MVTSIAALVAIAGYLLAAFLVYRDLGLKSRLARRPNWQITMTIALALVCHASVLFPIIDQTPGPNLALGSTVSIVAFVVVMVFLFSAGQQPILALALILLPTAAVTVALGALFPGDDYQPQIIGALSIGHSLIGAFAYAFLTLAVAQALLAQLQESLLKQSALHDLVRALPAVEIMERVLFQLITIGFALLSITLVSGMLFSDQLSGRAFVLNHHVVLAFLAWGSFAILLTGRVIAGWRGQVAVKWTLGSFVLLLLAYFGTRFVIEVLLTTP